MALHQWSVTPGWRNLPRNGQTSKPLKVICTIPNGQINLLKAFLGKDGVGKGWTKWKEPSLVQ